jgi:hypothetical protein
MNARGTAIVMVFVMLALAPAAIDSWAPAPATRLAPARLAIYYGYPSLVNGASGDVERAAATFADYDVIVFGDGLEFPDLQPRRTPAGVGPDEHRRTRAIIERLRARSAATRVYGYVDLGNTQKLPVAEVQNRVRLWSAMGVAGIFLDEAGYDFGVTRERQNAVVDFIHDLGLSAFVNAFNPDDVFTPAPVALNGAGGGNPGGLPTRLGANDAFLLESFQVRLGEPEAWPAFAARTAAAVAHRKRFQTRLYAVTTTTDRTERLSSQLYPYAWWSAALWGLDGFGWGEPDFSGATSKLPDRHAAIAKAPSIGTQFISPVTETADGLERRTNAGRIVISRTSKLGRFVEEAR